MTERALPRPEDPSPEPKDILDPHHTYSAYIFHSPDKQGEDIAAVISQAAELGYPVRYWWLSDAIYLDKNDPDVPLIVCAHLPRGDQEAGMDLYEALKGKGIGWDDLELAAMTEYAAFGKPIRDVHGICSPTGEQLFPPPPQDKAG